MDNGSIKPQSLKCEYRVNPLGIDIAKSCLSWVLESNRRAQVQTGYQVLVASSLESLRADRGDLWDSGKVASQETVGITYAGKLLDSSQRVYWKVRVWDGGNRASGYSAPAWWEIALLDTGDWQGKWIRQDKQPLQRREDFYGEDPAPLLRQEFTVDKKVKWARAYVSGLGYYELYLNGQKVGDRVLDPGWTTYTKQVLYSALLTIR